MTNFKTKRKLITQYSIVISHLVCSLVWADTGPVQMPESPPPVIVDSAMTGEQAMIALSELCPPEIKDNQIILDVFYIGFDGALHQGQILIDSSLADDIRQIFQYTLEINFPIQSVIPLADPRFVKAGAWDDDLSMALNNTSGFNYRAKTGGTTLSFHALGRAIDINPSLNPYVKGQIVLPPQSVYDINHPGTLHGDHPLVKKFKGLGWSWGGDWETLKDYQHFEKAFPDAGTQAVKTP